MPIVEILEYSVDQARDELGRWTSSEGEINTKEIFGKNPEEPNLDLEIMDNLDTEDTKSIQKEHWLFGRPKEETLKISSLTPTQDTVFKPKVLAKMKRMSGAMPVVIKMDEKNVRGNAGCNKNGWQELFNRWAS